MSRPLSPNHPRTATVAFKETYLRVCSQTASVALILSCCLTLLSIVQHIC